MLVGGRCRRKTKYAVRIGCRLDGPVDHDTLIEQFDIDRLRVGHPRNLSRSFGDIRNAGPADDSVSGAGHGLDARSSPADDRAVRKDLPIGTVTFLFTDVEGSTRLLHGLGAEAYAEALAEHRRVVREACAEQGGVEVDTQGDAFFVAFPTAHGALEAARRINEGLDSGPIRLRMGLHTGTPLVTDEVT